MNAVGIDVSKGKSMVAALRPMGEVDLLPQEFLHTALGLDQMAHAILALGEDTRVVMEATGHYHEPVAAALSAYGMYGIGETTAAQLMAEIGDVRRFPRRSLIVASPVLIRLLPSSASTRYKALLRRNAVRHI